MMKSPQTMQVTPDTLENREAPVTPKQKPADELTAVKAELAALRARVETARQVLPLPAERHCLDCFTKGRNAAIRAIVGEG